MTINCKSHWKIKDSSVCPILVHYQNLVSYQLYKFSFWADLSKFCISLVDVNGMNFVSHTTPTRECVLIVLDGFQVHPVTVNKCNMLSNLMVGSECCLLTGGRVCFVVFAAWVSRYWSHAGYRGASSDNHRPSCVFSSHRIKWRLCVSANLSADALIIDKVFSCLRVASS